MGTRHDMLVTHTGCHCPPQVPPTTALHKQDPSNHPNWSGDDKEDDDEQRIFRLEPRLILQFVPCLCPRNPLFGVILKVILHELKNRQRSVKRWLAVAAWLLAFKKNAHSEVICLSWISGGRRLLPPEAVTCTLRLQPIWALYFRSALWA